MNILDFLRQDHNKLRKDLVNIRQNLDHPNVRGLIKRFVSDYELHESTEEEILFQLLDRSPRDLPSGEAPEDFREEHGHIWILLDHLIEALDTMRFSDFQKIFFHFAAATDAHMGLEERILFPSIEARVHPEVLEEMGKETEARFTRFSCIEEGSAGHHSHP